MWTDEFFRLLPLMGHRNWILVVDKAYPLQSAHGITYIDTRESLPDALEQVLVALQNSSHIRPIIYTDKELNYLDESFCPGIDQQRSEMKQILGSYSEGAVVKEILHDEVFTKLDTASKLFNVIVLKTESVLPYTSVFIELDCGYWKAEQEAELRKRME